MAQNPYADIFGRLIEYSFQKKMLDQRLAEQRKMFEEQQAAAGRAALASQLTKEAESINNIANPEALGKLTSNIPGVKIEVDPQAEAEGNKRRADALQAASNLYQGKNVEDAGRILSDLVNFNTPAIRQDEGGRTFVQVGNARILLAGTSEEAAQQAANIKTLLTEVDTKNKLNAERLAIEQKMASMLGGLPEDPKKKEPLYNMFNEFNAVVSTFSGDAVSRAAAVSSFAANQLVDMEGSEYKDDPTYANYRKFLKRTIDVSNAVLKAHSSGQSAAARSQAFNERAAAAAYAIGELANEVNKGLPAAKVDYGQFVKNLWGAMYGSDKGKAILKQYGPAVAAAGLKIVLSMYNPTIGQMPMFGLPSVPGGQ